MLFDSDDYPSAKERRQPREPFSLSEVSGGILVATLVMGIIYAVVLARPVVAAWCRGERCAPLFEVVHMGMAAELLAFVPLAIIALKRDAERGLPREARLERITAVTRWMLVGLGVFMISCVAALCATGEKIFLPGSWSVVTFGITWQDLRSWRRFRKYLDKREGRSVEPVRDQTMPGDVRKNARP